MARLGRFRRRRVTESAHIAAATASIPPDHFDKIERNGDNRHFVVDVLLPRLDLPADVRQVIRWAYGYDGSPRSFEMKSDGSTAVPDNFMGGKLKEPQGVGHDMLFKLHRDGLALPNGERWGFARSNWWYKRAMQYFGYPVKAWVRFVGLMLFGWLAWNRHRDGRIPSGPRWK